ncbi:MAG: peptidoglycan-binding protein [Firmicutes bacterium]|nr:peptidoglycan-binding protein [Bacillota bacterium]
MRFRLSGSDGRQPGGRLGCRVLRAGDKGEDVRALQTRLIELGYAVGAADGIYGFMTEDAVRDLQKEFRLRIDGIAGRQVHGVIREKVPQTRLTAVVKPQDTLMSLAGRYGVSELAIRSTNHLRGSRSFYSGRRLVVHRREVAGILDEAMGPAEAVGALNQHFRELSFVCPVWFRVAAGGALRGETMTAVANLARTYRLPLYAGVRLGPWSELSQAQIKNLLWSRRLRRRVVEEIFLLSQRRAFAGINLVLDGILPRDRRFVGKLARQLARRLKTRGTPLLITVPATTGARGERSRAWPYDHGLLAAAASRLILLADTAGDPAGGDPASGDPPKWDPAWLEEAISFTIKRAPCWKLMAGGPAGGDAGLPWEGLLPLINRYNMAGVAIYGPARDGQKPWRAVPHFFEVAR